MESQRAPGIASIASKYGPILGVASFAVSTVVTLAGIMSNWVAGVINAALLIALMVQAHRVFKRTHGGIMTYPEGLGTGTLLSIIASVVAAVLVYINAKYINPGSLTTALQAQRAALEQRGITGPQAQQAMAFIGAIMTPVGVAVLSLVVEVIVGFIVALIVSIFTQKSTHRP